MMKARMKLREFLDMSAYPEEQQVKIMMAMVPGALTGTVDQIDSRYDDAKVMGWWSTDSNSPNTLVITVKA